MKPLINVVDDDANVRNLLQNLLLSMDMDVICHASAQEFLDTPNTVQPGCVLLDLRMPNMSGLGLQRLLNEQSQPKPIIFLSGHANVEASVRAMHQGATEFLTKPVNEELLLEKIYAAIETNKKQRDRYMRLSTVRARLVTLTPREKDVLEGVFDGLTSKGVAQKLGISHKTVELHRRKMMAKMRAHSVAELVRMRMQAEPLSVPV